MITPFTIVGIAIVYCFLAAYLLNGFINLQYKKHIPVGTSPVSLSIIKTGYFVAAGFILAELPVAANALFAVLTKQYAGPEFYQHAFLYMSLFLGIILLILFIVYFLSSGLFHMITDKSRIRLEVANNNVEKAVFFSGLVLLLSLGIKASVPFLLDFFIPYPTIPMFR